MEIRWTRTIAGACLIVAAVSVGTGTWTLWLFVAGIATVIDSMI